METDKKVVDLTEKIGEKEAEKFKNRMDRMLKLYSFMIFAKIEIITGQDPYADSDNIRKVHECLDKAYGEFLDDDVTMERFGDDEGTPSIQLYLINKTVNRAVVLYFGDKFQPEKVIGTWKRRGSDDGS